MSYRCRICEKKFDAIPENAVEVNHQSFYTTYRFPNGLVHDLRVVAQPTPQPEVERQEPEPKQFSTGTTAHAFRNLKR